MQDNLWLGPQWAAPKELYSGSSKPFAQTKKSRWYIRTSSRESTAHHMTGVCGAFLSQLGRDEHALEIRHFFEQRSDPTYEQWAKFEDELGKFLLAFISTVPLEEYETPWDALVELEDHERQLFYRTVYYCSGYHAATLKHCDAT